MNEQNNVVQIEEMATNVILSDSAIKSRVDDAFGRAKFAEKIADTIASIRSDECITIALYGGWGTGKTSMLNMVKEAIEESQEESKFAKLKENTLVVEFNPWRYRNEDEILLNLFNEIVDRLLDHVIQFDDPRRSSQAVKIDPRWKRLQDGLERFSKRVSSSLSTTNSPYADMRASVNMPDFSFTAKELEETKRDIEAALTTHSKRLLVIVDDIDRLDKYAIQALFKTIKLIGNFKYTTYLVAFDKQSVEQTLGEVYRSTENGGEKFVDKIIQLPLEMPLLRMKDFNDYLNRLFAFELESLDNDDRARWQEAASLIFSQLSIISPRKAKRFINSIKSKWMLLEGEVNLVDLAILEAMNEFYPNIYKKIKYLAYKDRDEQLVYFDTTENEINEVEINYISLLLPIKNNDPKNRNKNEKKSKNQHIKAPLEINNQDHFDKRLFSLAYFDHYFTYNINDRRDDEDTLVYIDDL